MFTREKLGANKGRKKWLGKREGDEKERGSMIPLERFWVPQSSGRETTNHSHGGSSGRYIEDVQVIWVHGK